MRDSVEAPQQLVTVPERTDTVESWTAVSEHVQSKYLSCEAVECDTTRETLDYTGYTASSEESRQLSGECRHPSRPLYHSPFEFCVPKYGKSAQKSEQYCVFGGRQSTR